jgi:hypothetical protein
MIYLLHLSLLLSSNIPFYTRNRLVLRNILNFLYSASAIESQLQLHARNLCTRSGSDSDSEGIDRCVHDGMLRWLRREKSIIEGGLDGIT